MKTAFFAGGSDENKACGAWLCAKLGMDRVGLHFTTMAAFDDRIRGVVAYHGWNPKAGTIAMSAAADSKRCLTREVLYRMHQYPFEQIGCQAVILHVSERNAVMLRIAKALGYEQYRVPRLRGRDEAEVINVLYDDVWRASRFTAAIVAKTGNVV